MKLWQRVSGALKDHNSLLMAGLGRRHRFRLPGLETAVIKATSHDDRFVDYKNTQRVFAWVRTSPSSLLPLVIALTHRLSHTRSSIVAIKGLMLFHGVLCTNLPSTRKIGRLPFDLSAFEHPFVRSYFNFLDRKSVNLFSEIHDPETELKHNETVSQRLEKLERWHDLLDLLLQIRPIGRGTADVVIFEAMECVIIEVFDVYSKICDGIANVMIRIYAAAEPASAAAALGILRRAMSQAEELSDFFVICREIGLLSETECPKVEKVSEDDVRELERIINGVSAEVEEDSGDIGGCSSGAAAEDDKKREEEEGKGSSEVSSTMRTIITDKWEVFDEEMKVGDLIDLSDDYDGYNSAIVPLYNYNNHNHSYYNDNNDNYHYNCDANYTFIDSHRILSPQY